jgi:hypothetical protein
MMETLRLTVAGDTLPYAPLNLNVEAVEKAQKPLFANFSLNKVNDLQSHKISKTPFSATSLEISPT